MRYIIILVLAATIFAAPATAFAGNFNMNISVSRMEDGTTCGELWFNNKVFWRLQVLADGARPVSSSKSVNTTLITPDIINGLFLIKFSNETE